MALEQDLEGALLEAYKRIGREAGYWAAYFLRSLKTNGAVATVKRLLEVQKQESVSKGFRALLEAGRVDLSVESIALQPRFRTLFTVAELSEARRRLQWPAAQGIADIAEELNRLAEGRPIGGLQALRRELHGRTRTPTQQLFDSRTIFDHYAFHVGGRTELQFNIGLEVLEGQEYLRHGVAFSLQLGQNLRAIDPLVPKIARFNEFLRAYPDDLSDLRMWHHSDEERSTNYPPAPIPPENVRPGIFICLGRLQPPGRADIGLILDDFDRLLPLYRFVESADVYPVVSARGGGFRFSAGCSVKPSATRSSVAARQLDVFLRHNELQLALHNCLAARHGPASVGTEQGTGTGTRVDVVVRLGDRYHFYEIKTGLSARACVREALAQLLEYSFWPGAQEAERLIVVGEPPLDVEARTFLSRIRDRFSLPVYYQQFNLGKGTLVE